MSVQDFPARHFVDRIPWSGCWALVPCHAFVRLVLPPFVCTFLAANNVVSCYTPVSNGIDKVFRYLPTARSDQRTTGIERTCSMTPASLFLLVNVPLSDCRCSHPLYLKHRRVYSSCCVMLSCLVTNLLFFLARSSAAGPNALLPKPRVCSVEMPHLLCRRDRFSVCVFAVFTVFPEQEFLLIRPTPSNLKLYEDWIRSPTQSQVFFGDLADVCYRCTTVRQFSSITADAAARTPLHAWNHLRVPKFDGGQRPKTWLVGVTTTAGSA